MGFHNISNTYLNFGTICHITRRYSNSSVIWISGQSGQFWTNYNPLSSPCDLVVIDQITGGGIWDNLYWHWWCGWSWNSQPLFNSSAVRTCYLKCHSFLSLVFHYYSEMIVTKVSLLYYYYYYYYCCCCWLLSAEFRF